MPIIGSIGGGSAGGFGQRKGDFGLRASFLVLAGGGGGGYRTGGGAGAGGYRSSYNGESSGGGGSAEAALSLLQEKLIQLQ
jgi:hypothetical protein